jgi:hypothetical protein
MAIPLDVPRLAEGQSLDTYQSNSMRKGGRTDRKSLQVSVAISVMNRLLSAIYTGHRRSQRIPVLPPIATSLSQVYDYPNYADGW